jgi:4-oxalocrotonate tautomerase
VLIEQVSAAGWSIGAKPVTVAGHLDMKVTEGTNTPEEKARFIAAAAQLLKDVLGPELPTATYVVVHEVPADSWGYDGLTQDYRRGAAAT